MDIKNVFIVGAGALGMMYAPFFINALGKDNVYFIADEQRTLKYNNTDYYINDKHYIFNFVCEKITSKKADLIIFAVKFTGMDQAIRAVKNIVDDNTIFLSVMNGIESEEVIKKHYSKKHLLYCEVHGMDAVKEDNKIYFDNVGTICFSREDNKINEDVIKVKNLLEKSGLNYEIPRDIKYKMWNKLMLNDAVNQVCAVFETNYGGIQKEGKARKMVIDVMKEVQKIAKAEGVTLTDNDIKNWLMLMDTLSPNNMPSLRQDTKAKRKTEVELFSGTIIKLGKKHNIKTPLNDYLYKKIKEIENSYK